MRFLFVVAAAAWKLKCGDTLIRDCLIVRYVIRQTLHDGSVS